MVYPHYISKQKTVAQGRRIPKELGARAALERGGRGGGRGRGAATVGARDASGGATAASRPPAHTTLCRTLAACDHPTTPEIVDIVVNELKLPGEVEVKHYPRDFMIRGRVRVQLCNEDGTPVNPAIPNRACVGGGPDSGVMVVCVWWCGGGDAVGGGGVVVGMGLGCSAARCALPRLPDTPQPSVACAASPARRADAAGEDCRAGAAACLAHGAQADAAAAAASGQ